MKPWTQTWLLAKREFVERVRSRPFLITMAILVLVILAIGPLVSVLSGSEPDATQIGLTGQVPEGLEAELMTQGELFGLEIETAQFESSAEYIQSLAEGGVDAVVVGGAEIVFHEQVSGSLTALIQRALYAVATRDLLGEFGLSDDEINAVADPVPVPVSTVETTDSEEEARQAAAFFGALLLYGSIIMFGQFVAMGTVEEKQNRVVEVVLSRVRPWQVLVGKVAGIGLLGLLQLASLVGAVYVSVHLAGIADVDVSAIGLPIIAGVFFWFILGYTFYAFLYAAVGSTVSRQEDLQGAMMLPIFLIIPGYLFAIAAAEDPDSVFAIVGSLAPMWAPFVMPIRIAADAAAPWEIAVSVIGAAIGAIVLVWVGARVYRGALLRTGTKMKMKDAWKSAVE